MGGEYYLTAVNIKKDYCSRCMVCYSVCPYEAIKISMEDGALEIDGQRCQVCGICYSACPSRAIDIIYYNYHDLIKHVEDAVQRTKADALVYMCRGNSPSPEEIEEMLIDKGISVESLASLRLPCSGRVPLEFIFSALKAGVKKVISIRCNDEFCRFKKGSRINAIRLAIGKKVLESLGYPEDAITTIEYSLKAIYFTEKCVGCDKCVFICPYKAIEAEDFATPKILDEKCMGCGACALACPHHAIQVKGFEFEKILERYVNAAMKLKAGGKAPTVLAFCCLWSEFSFLDRPEIDAAKGNVVVMEIPCFKALDPVHVVYALQNGFDGVIAVVCSEEDCKLKEGRDIAERNMKVLGDVLLKMGLQERFALFESSPRLLGDFEKKLNEFLKKIFALGCVGGKKNV
ncbi:MAG: hydrogenase iron-sulfur subunit [Candidatus Bathyarchaeia archaeon]|nr:hydrogenase iron-sulfur subunit [Candidatus Bathyarchaeota archaeon]